MSLSSILGIKPRDKKQFDLPEELRALTPDQDPTAVPRYDNPPNAPLDFRGRDASDPTVMQEVIAVQQGAKPTVPQVKEPLPVYQTGPDASTLSDDEKRKLIFDDKANSAPAQSASAPPLQDGERVRRVHEAGSLSAEADELRQLQTNPATDHNGRFKSVLLNMLHQAGRNADQALAHGAVDEYGLASIAGGAAGGGVAGAINPALDEQAKRQQRIEQLGKGIERQVKVESLQAKIAAAQGGRTPAQIATQQRGFANFLAKFYPNGYTRGTRPDIDAQLDDLHMQPPPPLPKKGGSGRPMVATPGQGVLVSDGAGGFTFITPHGEDGEPAPKMTPYQEQQLSDDDKRLTLQLAQFNLNRAHAGLGPMSFAEWKAAGSPSDVQPNAPSASGIGPRTPPASTTPVPEPAATPTVETPAPASISGIRPRGSSLVPTGAPPEKITPSGIRARGSRYRGSGGGGGYRSSSSDGEVSKGDSIAYGQLTGVIRDIEQGKDMASREAAKGNQKGAEDILGRVRALTEMARHNPNYRDKIEVGESDGWPYIKLRETPQAAKPATRGWQPKHDPLGLFQ